MNPDLIYASFIILFAYFILLNLYYLFLTLIAVLETGKRQRESFSEDYHRLSVSAFTLPVSFIIPAHNEESWILDCLQSVMAQQYPEFEVIVVDDCSVDKTFALLEDFLKLEAAHKDYSRRFSCGDVGGVFVSRVYPNVTVIQKTSSCKKAGALNSGLNLAKYKYVCTMDADTVLEPSALIKIMAQIQKNPDKIIGAGGYFGLVNGFKIKDGRIIQRTFSLNPLVAYQNIEYIRSLAVQRVAWSRLRALPIIAGGFSLWRRDILLELGGFAPEYSSEDLEFTFRANDYIIEKKKPGYQILMLPYLVGWTEGPQNLRAFITQRDRWQRVVDEAVWKYRHMIFRPSHKALALITLPYFLLYEVLGVFVELFSIGLAAWGAWQDILDAGTFLAFVLFMVVCNALISLSALFIFVRTQPVLRLRDMAYFSLLIFLEFFWYRWLLSISKLRGTLNYCKRIRSFDQYTRSKR